MYDERFLRRAIEISATALDKPGTEPFGAVVVRDGEIVGEGLNHAQARKDPTSHGETEAIRDACARLGTTDLTGCDLYTSCEPCPLCVSAMLLAGIGTLYYAADLSGSRAALAAIPQETRHRSDIAEMRRACATGAAEREMPSRQDLADEAVDVLRRWAATRTG